MKQQLTPIPPHIKITKCPAGVAEGATNTREWRKPVTQATMNSGCRMRRSLKPDANEEPTLF